jgi:CBS domain-containing protein
MTDEAVGVWPAAGASESLLPTAALVHRDMTLRQVANLMAEHDTTHCVVVNRDDESRPVGTISLQDLLAGRRRDLAEAQDLERVLRVSLWPTRAS